MPKIINPLFFLVKNYQINLPSGFQGRNSKLDGTPFYMLHLPCNHQTILIGDTKYNLENHHISIYSDYIRANNSDYHYTAEITEQTTGRLYKLRIYADAENNVSMVSLKSEEVEQPLTETDKIFLSQLAVTHTASIVRQLRTAQKEHIKSLSNQVSASIKRLPSLAQLTIEELEQCVAMTDKIIAEAITLWNLGSSDTPLKILTVFKNNIDWAKAYWLQEHSLLGVVPAKVSTSKTQENTPPSPAEEDRDTSPIAQIAPVEDADALEKKNAVKYLDEQLEWLKQCQTACRNGQGTSTPNLIAYEKAATEALAALLICDDIAGVSHGVAQIDAAISESRTACANQLTRQLLNKAPLNELDTSGLEDYVSYLSEDIIPLLVTSDAPDQLRWLLNKRKFPLDHLQIKDQQHQKPLLVYAYENKQLQCFKLLLQHNASSLVTMPNQLPLAHRILQDNNNDPFYFELTNVIIKSEGGIQRYFKRLVNLLNAYSAQRDTPAALSKQINEAIVRYQSAQSNQRDFRFLRLERMVEEQQTNGESSSSAIHEQSLANILSSQRVIEKREQYRKCQRDYSHLFHRQPGKLSQKTELEIIAELEKLAAGRPISEATVLAYFSSETSEFRMEMVDKNVNHDLQQVKHLPGKNARKLEQQLKAIKKKMENLRKADEAYQYSKLTEIEKYHTYHIEVAKSVSQFMTDATSAKIAQINNLVKKYGGFEKIPNSIHVIYNKASICFLPYLKTINEGIQQVSQTIEEATNTLRMLVKPSTHTKTSLINNLSVTTDQLIQLSSLLVANADQCKISIKNWNEELDKAIAIEDTRSNEMAGLGHLLSQMGVFPPLSLPPRRELHKVSYQQPMIQT